MAQSKLAKTLDKITNKLVNNEDTLIKLFAEFLETNLARPDVRYRITELGTTNNPLTDGNFPVEDALAFPNYLDKTFLEVIYDVVSPTISIAAKYHAQFYGVSVDDLFDGYFLTETSYDVYLRKYALRDKNGELVDKNVYGTFARVAATVALASAVNAALDKATDAGTAADVTELAKESVRLFNRFYSIMALGLATGAGRIMANAGASEFKPSTTLINCTVMKQIPDSMTGIMDVLKDAAVTLKSGAGVGYAFSTIRPKGAFVQGAGAETSGVLSFMRVFDQMCQTIESAGGRRGAQMATLHVAHPEIEDYIVAKQKDGELRAFNLSVFATDDFMKAVEEDGDWELWFWKKTDDFVEDIGNLPEDVVLVPSEKTPFDFPGYAKFVFATDHVESIYGNAKLGQIFVKEVYKTVKASELYDKIMRATYEYSEPGILFYDTINEKNPINEIETLIATNPCFVGATRISTSEGLIPIKELAERGGSFDIVVDKRAPIGGQGKPYGDIGTTIKTALKAFPTGKKPIRRLVTQEGYELTLTPDHKLLTPDGYIEVQDLEPGDKVFIQSGKGHFGTYSRLSEDVFMVFPELNGQILDINIAYLLGIYSATGSAGMFSVDSKRLRSLDKAFEFLFLAPKDVVAAFIRGYFSLSRNSSLRLTTYPNMRASRLTISGEHHSLQFLKDLQLILLNFGIYSKLDESAHKLVLHDRNISTFIADILDATDSLGPDKHIILALLRKKNEFTATIRAINDEGYADVYDLTEPDTHSLIASGIISHNCGESPLNPSGSCLLGSVYLHRFVKEPFKDIDPKKNFDWDIFVGVVDSWNEFLDAVNVVTNLPLPALRREAYVKRRHGLGFTGLADMLAALKLPYGKDKKTIEFVRLLTAVMEYQSFVLSNSRLARKYGPGRFITDYSWEKSKELVNFEPVVLADNVRVAEPAGFSMLNGEYGYNLLTTGWALIEENLPRIAHNFIEKQKDDADPFIPRYSHSLSIAPTGTISFTFGNNVANGIEPVYALAAIRNIIVPGKKTKDQMKVSYFLNTWYKNLTGTDLSELPVEEWPDWVKTASYNVDVEDHVAIQGAIQDFVSQAISKTVNLPADYPFEDFKKLYLSAWKLGLKGITSYKFNPAFAIGVLSSVELLTKLKIRFTVKRDDGTTEVVEVSGMDTVEYDGEEHNAANLFEALKEGMYGKY